MKISHNDLQKGARLSHGRMTSKHSGPIQIAANPALPSTDLGCVAQKADDASPYASCSSGEQGNGVNKLASVASLHCPASEANANISADIYPAPMINTGLIIVVVDTDRLIPYVRNAMTSVAIDGESSLGFAMPNVTSVLSLYDGNPRSIEQAKLMDAASHLKNKSVRHDYEGLGSAYGVDWCGNEGRYLLLQRLSTYQWVFVEQEISRVIPADTTEGMIRISQAAKEIGARVMLFAVSHSGWEKHHLRQVSDEYIEVAMCDPDAEDDLAFAIDCVGLRRMNCFSIGKTMCSIKYLTGKFVRRFSPFVASSLEDRLIWGMRAQGDSLSVIADTIGKNKSSVLRRLQGMPPMNRDALAGNWLATNLEILRTRS